ncbi:MAG: hypothetical protein ACI936_003328 [Paraglaciecola sp.]|jgi:hypothetical protein
MIIGNVLGDHLFTCEKKQLIQSILALEVQFF